MSTNDLCAILRGGTSALHKHWGKVDNSDDTLQADEDEQSGYNEFLKASFEDILKRAKEFEKLDQAKLHKEIDSARTAGNITLDGSSATAISAGEAAELAKKVEEEEMALLQGIEVVRSSLFEGKKYQPTYHDIGKEWSVLQSKRNRKSTTTIIDGHVVESTSVNNERWQAVKTITSDPVALAKLQDTKRVKKKFDHEEVCLACHDGGELYMCGHCPRVAHFKCLGYTKADLKKMITFICSQHRCVVCGRATSDAGGMLYRCQTCPDAYCEDCLPQENFYSMGDVLPEFLLLGYPQASQSHFIRCVECLKHFEEHPDTKVLWEEEEQRVKAQLKKNGIPFLE